MDKSKRSNRGQGNKRGGRGRGRGRGKGQFSMNRSFKKQNNSKVQKTDPFDDDDDDIEELDTVTLQRLEDNALLLQAFKELNLLQDLPGFDTTAGQVWIYPTNKPVRDYQYQIVQTALFHNTLVCLPTGLGKTFVAAVIMFNFHRWYPNDKIIFMAPTRPLVTQQLDACLHSVGIHRSVTIEMTGNIPQKKRDELWKTKKVFFLTPQILEGDIKRGTCPTDQIRCIVIDEAHKALGNYSYAVVIQTLSKLSKLFRVIALSATPGTDSITVKQVLDNLLISKLELRSEHSSEILPYIHDKKVEAVVVPLEDDDFLTSIHKKFIEQFQLYTGRLITLGVIPRNNVVGISSFQLLKHREMFRKNVQSGTDRRLMNQKGYIELLFAVCISLANAIERLLTYGLRVFFVFFEDVLRGNKMSNVGSELRKNPDFEEILNSVRDKLKITLENSTFNIDDSGLSTSITTPQKKVKDTEETDYLLSHPKMKYLKNIVEQHFKTCQTRNVSTRIMIFSKLRDSVVEIAKMLCGLRPLVNPMIFYGQADSKTGDKGNRSRGLKQKEQQQILEEFREGNFNTLISTSVGEEGLDIGDIDLIICYDSSNSSNTLVQRMGRTGRKRDGKIIFLLTKGKEEQMYHASKNQNRSINKQIMDPDILTPFLFPVTPRMVPAGLNPECFKMNIIIPDEENEEDALPIEEDDDEEHLTSTNRDDTDFVVPIKKKKTGKSKSVSVKLPSKNKLTKNNTVPVKKTNNEQTITKFFESMEKKNIVKSKSSTNNNDDVELITIDDDEIIIHRTHITHDTNNDFGGGGGHISSHNNSENSNKVCDNSNISVKNVSNNNTNSSTGGKKKSDGSDDSCEQLQDNFELLAALLDIKDYYGPNSSAPPCVFVPLPKEEKRNVVWKEEYNELSDSEFVISNVDLESIREKVDWTLLFGGVGCKCGNSVTKTFCDIDDDDDMNFNNNNTNSNKMDIDDYGSYNDNFLIKKQEKEISGKMNNLSIQKHEKNKNPFAATSTTTSNISTTSSSTSDDYIPSFSYKPKNSIVSKPEDTTSITTTTTSTTIEPVGTTTTNATNNFSTIRHPFRTTPNPSILYNTPKEQRNWSPTPIKATSPPSIYKPLASTPIRHWTQSNKENNLKNTVVTDAASFDIGFVLDENDPLFDDDWNGEMEEEEIKEVPKTKTAPETLSVPKENNQFTFKNKFNFVNKNDCTKSISNTNLPNTSAPSTSIKTTTTSNNSNSCDSEPVKIHSDESSTASESAFEMQYIPPPPKQQKQEFTDFSSSFHHQHNNNTSNFTKSQTTAVFKDKNVPLSLDPEPIKASSSTSTWQTPIKYSENSNDKKPFGTATKLFPTESSSSTTTTNSESKKLFKFKRNTSTKGDFTLLVTPEPNPQASSFCAGMNNNGDKYIENVNKNSSQQQQQVQSSSSNSNKIPVKNLNLDRQNFNGQDKSKILNNNTNSISMSQPNCSTNTNNGCFTKNAPISQSQFNRSSILTYNPPRQVFRNVIESPVNEDIDCIPGTSSEEEGDYVNITKQKQKRPDTRKIPKNNNLKSLCSLNTNSTTTSSSFIDPLLVQQQNNKELKEIIDIDSDETNWDPDEILILSPPKKTITPLSPKNNTCINNTVNEGIIPFTTTIIASTSTNNNNNNTVIQAKDSVFSPELQNFKINPKPRFLYKPSAQTSGGNSNNNSLMNPPSSSSGVVLKTPEELQITPMKKVSSESSPDLLVTPSPEVGLNRRRLNVKRRIINSEDTPPYKRNPIRKTSQTNGIKIRKNPFVLDEAEQLDSDTSSGGDHDEKTDESKDTFVVDEDEDEEEHITGTQQQAMYIRSVKDIIPFRTGRVEKPLSPRTTTRHNTEQLDDPWGDFNNAPPQDFEEDLEEDYMNDSFCSDGVEFADVGVFTQAMNVAKEQLLNSEQETKRKLRPRK